MATKIVNLFRKWLTLTPKIQQTQSWLKVAKKKKQIPGIDPEYLKKQKASLVRRHRQVIYLNDSEMAAINQFCEKFRVGAKATLYREAIMEKVLTELEDNHPTLF